MSEEFPAKAPSYEVTHVMEDASGKSHYTRMGVTFPHKDEKGHTFQAASFPGRFILREPRERVEQLKAPKDKEAADREVER